MSIKTETPNIVTDPLEEWDRRNIKDLFNLANEVYFKVRGGEERTSELGFVIIGRYEEDEFLLSQKANGTIILSVKGPDKISRDTGIDTQRRVERVFIRIPPDQERFAITFNKEFFVVGKDLPFTNADFFTAFSDTRDLLKLESEKPNDEGKKHPEEVLIVQQNEANTLRLYYNDGSTPRLSEARSVCDIDDDNIQDPEVYFRRMFERYYRYILETLLYIQSETPDSINYYDIGEVGK